MAFRLSFSRSVSRALSRSLRHATLGCELRLREEAGVTNVQYFSRVPEYRVHACATLIAATKAVTHTLHRVECTGVPRSYETVLTRRNIFEGFCFLNLIKNVPPNVSRIPATYERGTPVEWRKEAWSFYRTISGVRLCSELEKPKGPKGPMVKGSHRGAEGRPRGCHAHATSCRV